MSPFAQRHEEKIAGALSCLNRVVITGTLSEICHAGALAGHLTQRDISLLGCEKHNMKHIFNRKDANECIQLRWEESRRW